MSGSDVNDSPGEQEESVQIKTNVPKPNEAFALYVRAPNWIKDRENAAIRLKQIDNRIINVRHPRQKSTDYCFIDFATATDRDAAYKDLLLNKELYVKPVTRDNAAQLKKRIETVQSKRKAKQELRKLLKGVEKVKKVPNTKGLTNQILVLRVPRETTNAEIKEIFPNAIEVKLRVPKHVKNLASLIITFSTPAEAVKATKQEFQLHNAKPKVTLLSERATTNKKPKKKKKAAKKSIAQDS